MNSVIHTDYQLNDGVLISAKAKEKFSEFEKNYLDVRQKEKRVLSISEIKKLPFVNKSSGDYNLWRTPRHNIFRFLSWIDKKENPLKILDVGCGNGFFTAMMQKRGHKLTGLDVNLPELRQAAEAFGNHEINWLYADVMTDDLPENNFDLITFCCSFHYFPDPKALLNRCKHLLTPKGEIHIIDSPFYSEDAKQAAKQRSLDYFKSIGSENMHKFYLHNSFDVLIEFEIELKYKPNKFRTRLFHDSPFPWILIKNPF